MTVDGHNYLGGHVGSDERKRDNVPSLVGGWRNQLGILSEIAKHQPQTAYAVFVSGFRHLFTYHIRTIPGIENEIQEVDNMMDTKFLPITDGRCLSRDDRKLLTLPARLGVLEYPSFVIWV